MQETERLYSELSDAQFPTQIPPDIQEITKRLRRYEGLAEVLLSLMITGCYWGEESHKELWRKCLERIANPSGTRPGYTDLVNLKWYPGLLLLYGGGIASIAAGHYNTLFTLFHEVMVRTNRHTEEPALLTVHPFEVVDLNLARSLPGLERGYTPISEYLHTALREPLREFLSYDSRYTRCFDRFEYMLSLACFTLSSGWAPIGCFIWRDRRNPENSIIQEIALESNKEGENWPPLQAGFFERSLKKFQEVKNGHDQFLAVVRPQLGI